MVFRKPYAFLIKNFKKIHIFILILCAFLFYKTVQLSSFTDEFLTYLTYDPYLEPITTYTSTLFYLAIIIVMSAFLALMVLLIRKQKPWKLYIIPIFSYLFLFIVFIYAQNYFSSYDGETVTKTARAIHDFLTLATFPQYAVFLILIIRITGLDINKFGFKNDKEFLELEQDDREEFEVSINIDKRAFIRTLKRLQRTLGYFYEEHKFILNILISGLTVILIFNIYYFFGVSHKTIKENQVLKANNYEIKVNKSYYTNKDKTGYILEKDSSFVILNLTVTNNSGKRSLNTDNFHLKNGKEDITFSESVYSENFDDIGNSYTEREFRRNETRTFAMIFKVDKTLKKDNFTLYYQEYKSSNKIYLRKIKLNLEDISIINKNKEVKMNEKLKLVFPDKSEKNFKIESAVFENESSYNIESCDKDDSCNIVSRNINVSDEYRILKIKFVSNDFEGKELIDFSSKYGKIKYRDTDNLTRIINVIDVLKNKDYLGKYLYIKVPAQLEKSKEIQFIYTLRNQKYYYTIK